MLTAALTAGCGGSRASTGLTLGSILKRPGPNIAVTAGASDFAVGDVRYPFLVIAENAKPVERPAATVWVAKSREDAPFARVTAKLEPIGVPGRSEAAFGGVTRIYVMHVRIPRPGRYWLVAEPNGANTQALGYIDVAARSRSVPLGAKAPRSDTPTLATAPAAKITTSRPPDLPLLHTSVARALAAHRPFVVTFATPRFCTSRTCGPVVDVVSTVRRRHADSGVRFIHVEIYKDNDPAKGANRWVTQWNLPSEPWVFVVGPDGKVRDRFEGTVSVRELDASVKKNLLR